MRVLELVIALHPLDDLPPVHGNMVLDHVGQRSVSGDQVVVAGGLDQRHVKGHIVFVPVLLRLGAQKRLQMLADHDLLLFRGVVHSKMHRLSLKAVAELCEVVPAHSFHRIDEGQSLRHRLVKIQRNVVSCPVL